MNEPSISKRILVVDDSPIDRRLAIRILETVPEWKIDKAENGSMAMAVIGDHPPDLVITDLQMPEMDGLALVNCVKHRFPNLPVILITSKGSESIAAESLRAGATSYCPKSHLHKELLRTVQFVLDLSNHVKLSSMTNRSNFQQRFVLENNCNLVMPLIEHLQNFMPSWSEPCRLQLGMAIGEAIINAMHHGNLEACSSMRNEDDAAYYETIRVRRTEAPFCDRRVNVHVEFNQELLKISIRDEGLGFNPDSIPDPTAEENLTKPSGRGLLLIRSFMDEVTHNDRGNEITMIKRRASLLAS